MNAEDHKLLSETGPATRMGQLLRRYWLPAILSSEVLADGAPVRVTLLGEELIAFRDSEGRVGLFDEFCSHRGASLYYGRNGGGGLACWYHGWKYDVTGRCLATPNEPSGNRLAEKIRHKAYPCRDINGVVWAYLGPEGTAPELPGLEWLHVPAANVYVSKRLQRCHWTQGMEGDIDPGHLPFLHSTTIDNTEEHSKHSSASWLKADLTPKMEWVPRAESLLFASRRNSDNDTYFWRIGQWFMPCFTTIPAFPGDGPLSGHAWVPIDDRSSWVYTFTWHPTRAITAAEKERFLGGSAVHAELKPGTFEPACNATNEYAGDGFARREEDGLQPWMRIRRFQDQDICITETMGKNGLFDRTKEHLGSSDAILVRVRNTLMNAARRLEEGVQPPRDPREYRLRPVSVQLPRSVAQWADAVAERMDTRPETFEPSV
jgi:phenylpropionate dioxygenase-like ring-hydroxylating dioxygenase large terminal subunit